MFNLTYNIATSKASDKIAVEVVPKEATVAPGASQEVTVTVQILEPAHLSESVQLTVVDTHAPNNPQVLIYFELN
jgi:hypothetical protein